MKITVLIPCHNEEKCIKACVQSCLDQTRKPDEILVINDGSTDRSQNILENFGTKIKLINIYPATGNKSHAQEKGLNHVIGEVFVSTDGDTILEKDFIKNIEKDFTDPNVAAVGGYVKSLKYNWITACRAYDYCIGQNIHKYAQSKLNYMLVIPGAAGAFRTNIFKKYVGFDHDTITEDLDFTYKLHKNNFFIKYDKNAIVYTQDPTTLSSYINQMRRWYSGGWQNLMKHADGVLMEDPRRALELSLIYVEGLIFSITLYLIPIFNLVFAFKLVLLFFAISWPQAIYASLKEKRSDLLLVPIYNLFMMYVNSFVFVEQFLKEVIFRKKTIIWFHPERVNI